MAIYQAVEGGVGRKQKLLDLLETGKKGDLLTFYPGYGYRFNAFAFIKISNKTMNVYAYDRSWYERDHHTVPIAKVTKDGLHMNAYRGKWRTQGQHIGDYAYWFRAFLNLGMIGNVSLGHLRLYTLMNCNGEEVATYFPLKIDWAGNLIGRIPKAARRKAADAHTEDRRIKNNSARSNYQNTRVVRLMKLAESKGNWDKLKTSDIFCLTNVAKRTELIEHFGMDKILGTLEHEVVNKDEIDGRKYELLRFAMPDTRRMQGQTDRTVPITRPVTYLKMINPSTGESCVEGVPNNKVEWKTEINMNTVREALAWRDGDDTYNVPVTLT